MAKFQFGKLNGPGLRSVSTGLRQLEVPDPRKTKQVDPFYLSKEWMALSAKVRRERGERCEACGATEGRMIVDHIQERKDRSDLSLAPANLQVLCAACHGQKTQAEKDKRKHADWLARSAVLLARLDGDG